MGKTPGLHDGHRDRMREKYVTYGLDMFEAHEVLEMILYYAIPRRDVNALAHEILNHFGGSLDRVFHSSFAELESINGVTHNVAVLLKLFYDVPYRADRERVKQIQFLNTWTEIGDYLKPFFEEFDHEVVVILALDGKRKILFCRKMFEGTLSRASVNMRSLLQSLALSEAVYAVVAHNHPSGNAMPSLDDFKTTQQISDILYAFGISLVDHLIFADHDYVSFAQTGYLPSALRSANVFADPNVRISE